MATFIHQGCKGCRHCEGGARNIAMSFLTSCFLLFTLGFGSIVFPFIRKCPTCGHSYFLNKH